MHRIENFITGIRGLGIKINRMVVEHERPGQNPARLIIFGEKIPMGKLRGLEDVKRQASLLELSNNYLESIFEEMRAAGWKPEEHPVDTTTSTISLPLPWTAKEVVEVIVKLQRKTVAKE